MLAAAESRIVAASFGGGFVDDNVIRAARQVTIPVDYQIPPWDDADFDRASAMALFDAFGSKEKTLHAYPGRYHPIPEHLRDEAARFLARHLGRTATRAPFESDGDGGAG